MKAFKSLLLLTVVAISFAASSSKYDVGDTVSDFKLKNVDNTWISLSDFKTTKGVIIIFDCNTCPYSKAYNERIINLNAKYKDLGFPLVSINANDPIMSPGDSFDEMAKQAKKKKYDFPYLIDETQDVARAFGAANTPHVFVLKNNNGIFQVAYIGAIDNNTRDVNAADKKYVEEAVAELIAGKTVTISKTKALGCGIKYRK